MVVSKRIVTRFIIFLFFVLVTHDLAAQEVFLEADFDMGRPSGWIDEGLVFFEDETGELRTIPWDFQPGVREGAFPDTASSGDGNAVFYYESYQNVSTILTTPPVNLEFAVKPTLFFFHVMPIWVFGEEWHDFLKVHYRKHEDSAWVQLAFYQIPVANWELREINIPDEALSPTFQIGFEAINNYGNGVGVDEVLIMETEVTPMSIIRDTAYLASADLLASNTSNNQILRIDLFVYGNQDPEVLQSLTVNSLNTNDADVKIGGVRLYATSDTVFSTRNPIGNACSFINGQAVFTDINHTLLSGHNSIWLTYDMAEEVVYGNRLDAELQAHSIVTSKGSYPEKLISPPGYRWVTASIFFDDFEEDQGWILTEQFEINKPLGLGGEDGGYPDPEQAYSGDSVLGTDLSGQEVPGNYQPNISSMNPYRAISPVMDCYYYKDVMLSFYRWLNVEMWDKAIVEMTKDQGQSWHTIYQNKGFVADYRWRFFGYDIADFADREDSIQIRFSIPSSNGLNNYSGWNIDDFLVSGSFINTDVQVLDAVSPKNGSHHTDEEPVVIQVKNAGAQTLSDPIPVSAYFENADGHTFSVHDTIRQTMEPEDSLFFTFSATVDLTHSGIYTLRIVSELEADEYTDNDTLNAPLYVIPSLQAPYVQDFESEEHLWLRNFSVEQGENEKITSFQHGVPTAYFIGQAAEGEKAWVTRLGGAYRNYDTSIIYSPYLDLSQLTLPVVEFQLFRHVREGDGLVLEYTADTARTWHPVPRHAETYDWNWFTHASIPRLDGPGWSGVSSQWVAARQFLPTSLMQGEVQFRMRFLSGNNSSFMEGVGIDHFMVIDAPPDIMAHSILSPETACELSAREYVQAAFKNVGYLPLPLGDTLLLGAAVDTLPPVFDTLVITRHIAVNDTFHYTWTKPLDFSAVGDYELKVFSVYTKDQNVYADAPYNNDTVFELITVQRPYVDLGPDLYTVSPDTLILDALSDPGFDYVWSTGATDPTLALSEEGSYHVRVDNGLCVARDTIRVVKLMADLALSRLSPSSACENPDPLPVSFRLENVGTDTIRPGTDIVLAYQFAANDWIDTTYFFADTLLPDSAFVIDFSQSYKLSQVGTYAFASYLYYAVDENASNDSVNDPVFTRGEPDFSFHQDSMQSLGMSYDLNAAYLNDPNFSYQWEDGSEAPILLVEYPADKHYHVTVTDQYSCTLVDSAYVLLIVPDVGVVASVVPGNSCGPIVDEYVEVQIANLGTSVIPAGTIIPVYYKLGEDTPRKQVEWLLANPFDIEDTVAFVIDEKVTYDQYGEYYFMAHTDLSSDSVYQNDTFELDFLITPIPSVDLGEDMRVVYGPETILDAGNFASYQWSDGSEDRYLVLDGANNIPPVYFGLTVTDDNGCTASDETIVILDFKDVTIEPVVEEDTICGFSHHDPFEITFKNAGSQALDEQDTLWLHYAVNGNLLGNEIFVPARIIPQLHTFKHQLEKPVRIDQTGFHEIELVVEMKSDQKSRNDTISHVFYAWGLPLIEWESTDTIKMELPAVLQMQNDTFPEYLWSTGATTPMIRVDYVGWYTVHVTDQRACVGKDSIFIENQVGIQELVYDPAFIHLYPNPASDVLFVEVRLETSPEDWWIVRIFSSDGLALFEQTLSESTQIDVLSFPPGNYQMMLEDKHGNLYVKSFVKE